ncbi:vegetative cell wall protein gp1-like [Octodon degus]|uniref:Vegetative cell wall protein gp1-like n=1 Tax=Octodon degus TaxID=10160 RepID=A0A6P3VDC9_OCTDE|nr:vegetative cell wall protein gp1-like [Octodon degus]
MSSSSCTGFSSPLLPQTSAATITHRGPGPKTTAEAETPSVTPRGRVPPRFSRPQDALSSGPGASGFLPGASSCPRPPRAAEARTGCAAGRVAGLPSPPRHPSQPHNPAKRRGAARSAHLAAAASEAHTHVTDSPLARNDQRRERCEQADAPSRTTRPCPSRPCGPPPPCPPRPLPPQRRPAVLLLPTPPTHSRESTHNSRENNSLVQPAQK